MQFLKPILYKLLQFNIRIGFMHNFRILCKTGLIASGTGLLYVLHEIFCGFTQDNLKGASKD